jgi:hypothetical protein
MKQTEHNIRLTAAEIGSLWIQYMNDSMATCTLGYFLEKTDDTQIQPVLRQALYLAQSHVQQIGTFFSQEGFPIPMGFSGNDVTLTAPRLFSDPFHLNYIKNLSKTAMIAYGLALSLATRADVRSFTMECLRTAADLDEMTTQVMLSKGLYVRPPYVTASDQAEYIQSTKYLGSFFGDNQRRLSSIEIMHLFLNAQSNVIAKAILIGFSQVAQSLEIRELFVRCADIVDKHIKIFTQTLEESDIPAPMKLDTDVMASTVAPFSDKLMLFHILALTNMVLGYYAAAIGASLRLDISVDYNRLVAEIELFAYDAVRILINNGWAEEPPMAIDRKRLALTPS